MSSGLRRPSFAPDQRWTDGDGGWGAGAGGGGGTAKAKINN